jgi:signal transduction histidine kinase
MEFTIYSVIYFITATLAFLVAVLSWQRKKVVGSKELFWLTFSVAVCSWLLFFESASKTFAGKILWTKLSYVWVVAIPVFYLLFVLRFTKLLRLRDIKGGWLLFVIPLVTLVFAFTNEYHHFIWSGFSPISEETNIMTYYHGFWFWIGYTLYSYILFFIATCYLFSFNYHNRNKKAFRNQGVLVIIAGMCPWIVSIFYLTGLNPVEGLDITPIGTTISAILFTYAILRTSFLNLVPVARETLVETLPVGVIALDDQNRIQDINLFARSLLNIESEDVLGLSPDQAAIKPLELIIAIVSSEDSLQVDLNDDKGFRSFRIIKQPLKALKGSRLITIHEITEQIIRQREIFAAEQRYRNMYTLFQLMSDNLSDMLWAKDLDKKYIFANRVLCEKLLKVEKMEEAIGKTDEFFCNRELEKDPDNEIWRKYLQGTKESDDLIIQNREPSQLNEIALIDGELTNLDVRKAPIFDDNGNMIGIVGSATDVTVQKNIERELKEAKLRAEESDNLKSAFLANMSHEIRTPMNCIMGFVSILEGNDLKENERHEYLEIVKNNGERLLATLNDIIDISKIEAGQIQMNLTDFDINEILVNMYVFFKPEAEIRGLEYIRPEKVAPEMSIIRTDKEKLYSVVTNLIKNALKYTVYGFVKYECFINDTHLTFSVSDSGIGIPKEKQKAIFERFVQVDVSRKRTYEGSGLGLAISKAYVDMLGGEIWLESEVDKGSTFFVKIPVEHRHTYDEI